MRHYFAYGSNLSASAMRERCPDAREIGAASLEGYRFLITSSGYGSIIPSVGESVYGVVWTISQSDERALDDYEGVEVNLYRKESIRLGDQEALVYVQADTTAGLAHPGYLEAIIAAVVARGFPERYVNHLRALRYNPIIDSKE